MKNHKSSIDSRIWLGSILILIGGLFLLNSYGILKISIPDFLLRWQYLLILIGIVLLFTMQNKTSGVIFIAIGGFNLFPQFWPLVLVILGVYIILRTSDSRIVSGSNTQKLSNQIKSDKSIQNEYINDVSIFGGGNKKIYSPGFRGGKVTAIFGGSEINLEGCHLAEGENVIDILAIFGGSTLIVPNEWEVVLDIIPIFGGFSDSRRKDPGVEYSGNKRLIVKGFMLFGGGEIK